MSDFAPPTTQCKHMIDTPNGPRRRRQCTNRTRIGDLCWIHLKQQTGLRVKPSKLGGLGLFTTKDLSEEEELGYYDGELVPKHTIRYDPYIFTLSRKRYLSGANPLSGVMRYANMCTEDDRQRGRCSSNQLDTFIEDGRRIVFDVVEDVRVRKGQEKELFVNYGDEYFINPFDHAPPDWKYRYQPAKDGKWYDLHTFRTVSKRP